MTSSGGRVAMLRVTCGRDGYEHLVADEAMMLGGAGRYRAICGHGVWAAVLACPSGPPCPACVAARSGGRGTGGRGARQRHRCANSQGLWTRLIAWLHRPRRPTHRGVPR